jgi:hypothetical protein
VLALDDGALARLVIAASAIPPRRRKQWLRQLARQAEPPPCSPGARYTAAWRRREKAGRFLLRLEMDEAALVVGLVDCGVLDPLKADDRGAITEAAQRALVQFCDGGETSRQEQRIYDTLKVGLVLSALKRKLRDPSRRRLRRSPRPDRAA